MSEPFSTEDALELIRAHHPWAYGSIACQCGKLFLRDDDHLCHLAEVLSAEWTRRGL